MKKILFFLTTVFLSAVAMAQNTTNWQKISTPYQYRHLRADSVLAVPYGQEAILRQVGDETRPGALFCVINATDTLLKFWTGDRWIDIGGSRVQTAFNELIFGGSVTPLGGYSFEVQEAIYRIDNMPHESDSGTVIIDSAHATLNRIDRVYLGTDNAFHVKKGEPAVNALEPQLNGDEIGLAFITIPAGSDPYISRNIIYDDNAGESNVTSFETTVDPNNTTNTYGGSAKSINVTNMNDPTGTIGDQVYIDKTLGSWSTLGIDGISGFIKLKAPLVGNGNLRIQLGVGSQMQGNEVIISLNRTNTTTFQAFTISRASLGNIQNNDITRVRIRYTRPGSTANHTGFYLDNVFFMTGVVQVPSNTFSFNVDAPTVITATPTTIQNGGTLRLRFNGSAGDVLRADGSAAPLPDIIDAIGTVNGRTKSSDGAVIDGTEFFLQDADTDDRGLMTSEAFNRIWLNYYISNAESNIGDSLAFQKNDSTTGVKLLVAGTGVTLDDTDSTIVINASAGSGGFLPTSGTGTATGNIIGDLDGNSLTINDGTIELASPVTGGTNSIVLNSSDNLIIKSQIGSDITSITMLGDIMSIHSSSGLYTISNLSDDVGATKVITWNAGALGTQDISGFGGGSGTVNTGTANRIAYYPASSAAVDDLAAITANRALISDANGLPTHSAVTNTELGYSSGVTSAIQTQIDTKLGHTTSNPSHTVTNASGVGLVGTLLPAVLSSDFTLSNVGTAQTAFSSALDVFTLQGNTTYYFEGEYHTTTGNAAVTFGMGFSLGTATLTSINYSALGWTGTAGAVQTAQGTVWFSTVTPGAVTASNTTQGKHLKFSGIIRVNTGGTITPQVIFSADPTGTNLMKADSYIFFTPLGSGTYTSSGSYVG